MEEGDWLAIAALAHTSRALACVTPITGYALPELLRLPSIVANTISINWLRVLSIILISCTDIEQPLSRRNLINLAHFLSKQPKDFDLHLVQTFNEVMHLTLYAHADPVNPFEQLEHPS